MDTTTVNPPRKTRLAQLLMMVRREWWEHSSLRILPICLVLLVLAGSLLALVVPGRIESNLRDHNSSVHFNTGEVVLDGNPDTTLRVGGPHSNLARLIPGLENSGLRVELGEITVGNLLRFFDQLPEGVRRQMLLLLLLSLGKVLALPLGLLAAILALNMFRQEARNRSSYFFKSMPVTEGQAVLAKVLLNVPLLLLLFLATILLGQLIPLLVMSVAAAFHGLDPWSLIWQPAPLAEVWVRQAGSLCLDFLLFLPTLGFCYALNSWHSSRRFAALLTVAGLAVADKLFLTGGGFAQWLVRHVLPPGWPMHKARGDVYVEASHLTDALAFSWPDLAFGVLLGLAFLYAATHLLRWREER